MLPNLREKNTEVTLRYDAYDQKSVRNNPKNSKTSTYHNNIKKYPKYWVRILHETQKI